MAFLDNFKTHKVLEVNISTGIRTGHMLAQTGFKQPTSGIAKDSIDNGVFFTLANDGNVTVAAAADKNPLFVHYTEPLMTMDWLQALKYFTVDYDYKVGADKYAYPRLIALYSGDVYTTDNFIVTASGVAGEKPANETEYKYAIINGGALEVFKTLPAAHDGHVFTAKASTLPDGTAAIEVMYIK